MGDYLPEASNLVSSDTQVPVRDTCEDEDQDEDEMLRRAIDLSLRNDDAQVCEPRPDCNLETYQYSPLPSTDKTIRLLCIPPADHISDPLVCQMRQVSLIDKPEYAALSYTWGAPIFDHHIICDGRRLAITAHLDAALRRFRTTTWWTLWVDALCIDQTNIPERNYQVSIMKHIYSQALRTFVYLGEPCPFDEEALKLMVSLTELAQLLRRFSLIELMSMKPLDVTTSRARDAAIRFIELKNAGFPGARTRTTDLVAAGLPHPQHPAWEAMHSLFSRPWFSRVWIIQEVILSPTVVVMFGSYQITWKEVTESLHAYSSLGLGLFPVTRPQDATIKENFINSAMSLSGLAIASHNSQYRSLIKLLRSFRKCHSSDPRDKVYALLGLANDQGVHQMVPVDYAKSVEAVYLECAKFLIRNGDGMEMLLEAGISQKGDGNGVKLSVPSWVPNWTQDIFPSMYKPVEVFRAASETKPDMQIQDNGIDLNVKGIRIDVIDAFPPLLDAENANPNDFSFWERHVRGVGQQNRVLVTHKFCVTRRGYKGASPCSSQPGDLIILLYGGPMLFTVRETNGKYILLGITSLEGFMNGGALELEDARSEHFVLE